MEAATSPSPRTPSPQKRRGSIQFGGLSAVRTAAARAPMTWEHTDENFRSFTIPEGGIAAMTMMDQTTLPSWTLLIISFKKDFHGKLEGNG